MTTYPRSKRIRSTVLDFIQGACDNMKDKKRIENPAMEGLCAIFTRNDIDEEEKNRIRTLIVNTVDDNNYNKASVVRKKNKTKKSTSTRN